MITTQIFKSEKYSVVDRQEMETVLGEQAFQSSGTITDESAIKLGEMLGVEYGIFGSINDFSIELKSRESISMNLLNATSESNFETSYKRSTATLLMDIKMVNIQSGEITLAENIKSESDVDEWDGSEFSTEAISKNVKKISKTIVKRMEEIVKDQNWEAQLSTKIDDKNIVINSGEINGVEVDMEFNVFNVKEEIIDPTTGMSLGYTNSYSGRIKVIKNDLGGGNASVCSIIEEKDPFAVNDIIRIPENALHSIYRYYHEKDKDNFYTKNADPKKVWKRQGIEFYVFPNPE